MLINVEEITDYELYKEYNSIFSQKLGFRNLLLLLNIGNKGLSEIVEVLKQYNRPELSPRDISFVLKDYDGVLNMSADKNFDGEILRVCIKGKYLGDFLISQTDLYNKKQHKPKILFYILKSLLLLHSQEKRGMTQNDFRIVYEQYSGKKLIEQGTNVFRQHMSGLRDILKDMFDIDCDSKYIIRHDKTNNEYYLQFGIKLIKEEETKEKNNIKYGKKALK